MKKYTKENVQKFFDRYDCFERLNITGEDVNQYYQEWLKGNHKLFHDFLWSLFNKALLINGINFSNTGNESELNKNNRLIYLQMAYFRSEEGSSVRVINKFMRLADRSMIYGSLNPDVEMEVEIMVNPNCCSYCRNIEIEKCEIEDYLENPIIASNDCTNEKGCGCTISVVPKRDRYGQLIFKEKLK